MTQVNESLVPAQGSLGQGASYALSDANVAGGLWFYFLEDVDLYGVSTVHGPVAVETATPTDAQLTQFSGGDSSSLLPLTLTALPARAFVVFVVSRRQTMRA